MRTRFRFLLAASAAVVPVAVLGPATAEAARASRPRTTFSTLESAADIGARGRLQRVHTPESRRREERTVLRFRAQRLTPDATYSVWVRAQGDAAIDEHTGVFVTAGRRGTAQFVWDTRSNGLPLGETYEALATRIFRVKDADNGVVLSGPFPAIP